MPTIVTVIFDYFEAIRTLRRVDYLQLIKTPFLTYNNLSDRERTKVTELGN